MFYKELFYIKFAHFIMFDLFICIDYFYYKSTIVYLRFVNDFIIINFVI